MAKTKQQRKPLIPAATSSSSHRKRKADYYDYSLLAVIILLTCFGLIMLYSTSSYMAELNYGDDMYYFKKQAAISLACIVAALAISEVDYHILTKFTGVLYGAAAVLMLSLIHI